MNAAAPDGPAGRNWAGGVFYRAERLARPSSLPELDALLAGPGPVKVLGSRHTFNTLADTSGTAISLAGLPVEVDAGGAPDRVRVAGELRYGDLALRLAERGLALGNLASLPHLSIAGAIATGTHGSGDRAPSLAAAVRSITFATAGGGRRRFAEGDADFPGAVVHLGALGAVVELELAVEPHYEVAQTVYEAPSWDAMLAEFDAVTALGDSVSVFTDWRRSDRAGLLWVKRRTGALRSSRRRASAVSRRDVPPPDAAPLALLERLGATPADGPRHPIAGADTRNATEQQGAPGPWYERLPHFRLGFTPSSGAELQSEYLVPRADAARVVEALRRHAERIAPVLMVGELRTVAGDGLWLSPAYGADSVAFHFTWHPDPEGVAAALRVLEAELPATARPHWGKVFALPPEEVRARYPRWEEFARLRAELDPDGRFRNAFLAGLGL